MRKVSALFIFEWIQFSRRANYEAFLAKQNSTGNVTGRMSLFSAPSYQNDNYEATGRGIVVNPDLVLIETSTDNSRLQTERCSDGRSSGSLYTFGKA